MEDAITGRKLLIEKQLLNISMATGDVRRHSDSPCATRPWLALARLANPIALSASCGAVWRRRHPEALQHDRQTDHTRSVCGLSQLFYGYQL